MNCYDTPDQYYFFPIYSTPPCYMLGIFFFPVFLGLLSWHMEVSRLGVKSELQLPAYARATATWDLSHICNLHHSSWQGRILNPPLSKARDQTLILMVTSWVHYHCATTGTPSSTATVLLLDIVLQAIQE